MDVSCPHSKDNSTTRNTGHDAGEKTGSGRKADSHRSIPLESNRVHETILFQQRAFSTVLEVDVVSVEIAFRGYVHDLWECAAQTNHPTRPPKFP